MIRDEEAFSTPKLKSGVSAVRASAFHWLPSTLQPQHHARIFLPFQLGRNLNFNPYLSVECGRILTKEVDERGNPLILLLPKLFDPRQAGA